jgi:hypothetical protein
MPVAQSDLSQKSSASWLLREWFDNVEISMSVLIRPEVDQTKFRWDVNATGSINITDLSIVK